MIMVTAVDWQTDHPATQYGMSQKSYGLPAFEAYLQDIKTPERLVAIDSPYINCHAILFQADGRYHLGCYLKELAVSFAAPVNHLLAEAGDLYMETHRLLKRFIEYNILEGKTEVEIAEAISWVQDAYRIDEQILD